MSYRMSRARRTFEKQVALTLAELTPLHRVALKNGAGSASRLLGAYYVLVFAQLEVYVGSLVEDSLAAISTAQPSFDKWPDLMMAYLLHRGEDLAGHYRTFSLKEDEAALLNAVAGTARKVATWSSGGTAPVAIDSNVFLDRKKYPSPRNLPQLFRRLGVSHVWAIIGAAGHFNGELVLTSLNDLRTDIAHDGLVPPGFGFADFRDRVRQMRQFVAALDRSVSKHFCAATIARSVWNNSVA
jgi:hypothetical protein